MSNSTSTNNSDTPPQTSADADPAQGNELVIGPVPEAQEEAQEEATDGAEDQANPELDSEGAAADRSLAEVRLEDGATIALVAGQAVTELPKDLYIPPEALEVFLETFEGPLDLLLYLIRRQNLDILEVSVAEITSQYMGYIDLMTSLQLELVGEYLVMAAMLAEIKSRMLLPRPESIVEDEEDPRAELIRRLQQYERYKTAAENIDAMPRMDRDISIARAERPTLIREKADPDVDLREMLVALGQVLRKADMFKKHAVQFEPLTVRERMSNVLVNLRGSTDFVSFISLFDYREGRGGVVVTFLAVLELVREHMLDIVQNEPFAPLYVRPASQVTEDPDELDQMESPNEESALGQGQSEEDGPTEAKTFDDFVTEESIPRQAVAPAVSSDSNSADSSDGAELPDLPDLPEVPDWSELSERINQQLNPDSKPEQDSDIDASEQDLPE